MKFTVIGVIDGRRMEMPVEACSIVDAMHTAEAEGMIVTDVRSADNPAHAVSYPPPVAKPKRGDSPLLCFGLGFLVPILGVLVGILKWRDDQSAAGAAIVGAVLGFIIWGSIVSGL
jgi:hypothetical protein